MAPRSPQTLAVAFPSHQPRPLTGLLELSLAQEVWSRAPRPVRVGRVLALMFDQISGQPSSADRIRRLTSSAREWLLQRAALRVWADSGWFQAQCRMCERDFDLPITLAQAPSKPATGDFPVITVDTSLGLRVFEAPNGAHEEALAQAAPDTDQTRLLVALCGLAETAKADAQAFTAADLTRIDTAFEAACPDIADTVATHCPACQAAIEARIDPLQFAFPRSDLLLREVHTIASAYHWSEQSILELPRSRRAQYAALIRADKSGGRRA